MRDITLSVYNSYIRLHANIFLSSMSNCLMLQRTENPEYQETHTCQSTKQQLLRFVSYYFPCTKKWLQDKKYDVPWIKINCKSNPLALALGFGFRIPVLILGLPNASTFNFGMLCSWRGLGGRFIDGNVPWAKREEISPMSNIRCDLVGALVLSAPSVSLIQHE